MTQFWTNHEVAALRRHYPREGKAAAHRLPRHSVEAIRVQAARYGVRVTLRRTHLQWLHLAHSYFLDRAARGQAAAQQRFTR